MDNEALDKIKSGYTFGDGLMVFVSRIVEGLHGAAVGRIAAMNHLVHIFNNGRPGMEFVKDMFIIVKMGCKIFIRRF